MQPVIALIDRYWDITFGSCRYSKEVHYAVWAGIHLRLFTPTDRLIGLRINMPIRVVCLGRVDQCEFRKVEVTLAPS